MKKRDEFNSSKEYADYLIAEGDRSVANLRKLSREIKDKGLRFCPETGVTIYPKTPEEEIINKVKGELVTKVHPLTKEITILDKEGNILGKGADRNKIIKNIQIP